MTRGMPLGPDTSGAPDAPLFREPWEAQAFAMTLALHARGLFTWPEWVDALAAQISAAQAAGDTDASNTYHQHWLAALEALVAIKGASSASELEQWRDAWDHAADRAPHGQPIVLAAEDFDAR